MQEENLAGALGGFHRHGEKLLLRHAVLRSLALVILVRPLRPAPQQQFWPLASAFLGMESRRAVLDVDFGWAVSGLFVTIFFNLKKIK